MLALGLEPGDEVLVPAYTFPATANVVALAGLRPVLVDVDPETMNIDPARDRASARARRRCSRCTSSAGRRRSRSCPTGCSCSRTPPARSARAVAAARAAGSALLGCLSFHPRKIVTTGEGGAVTTNDAAIAEAVARAAQPRLALARRRPTCPRPGLNYRLSDILCAVGLPQMRRLDELLAARTRIADGYTERLAHLPVLLPGADEGDVHGWQAYVIQVDDRDAVLAALRAQGIEAQIGTYALQPARRLPRPGRVPRRRAASSSARSRCRSTRGSPTAISTGSRRHLTSL